VNTALAGVSVGTHYGGACKELILKLKFYRLQSAAEVGARLVAESLPAGWSGDLVTSVPVAAARYRERGYNQSGLVARGVAAHLGLPYRALLGRRASAEHQMGRDRAKRLAGVQGAFYALGEVSASRVLVVDDVVTTGATLSECARVLQEAGARAIWAAAIARH